MNFEKICTLLQKTELLNEAVIPPFDWNITVSMINRKSKALFSAIDPLVPAIKENESLFDDFGMRSIGYYLPDKFARYLRGNYNTALENLIERINTLTKTAQNTNDPHFSIKCMSEYIPDYISYFLKDNQMDRFEEYDAEITKFKENREWYNDDDDFKIVAKLLIQIQAALEEMKAFDELLQQLQKKLQATNSWSYGAYEKDRKFRPTDLAEIETVYHASIHAKQLLEKGFSSDHNEDESFGLGGSSYEKHISVTLDFKVAQTIAWAYKHLWLIAHEQWKLSSVFEFIRQYSKNPKKDKGGEYDFDKIVEIFKRNKGYASFPPKDIETLMEFFVQSLWFVNTPINKNPVFFGFDGKKFKEKFLTIDYKDIGVLKINAKTANISEFLTAEREFRVPPEDLEVISII